MTPSSSVPTLLQSDWSPFNARQITSAVAEQLPGALRSSALFTGPSSVTSCSTVPHDFGLDAIACELNRLLARIRYAGRQIQLDVSSLWGCRTQLGRA